MLKEDHKLNNVSEQSVSGASDSSKNLDKNISLTCVNDCSGKTLLVGSVHTLITTQNLRTNEKFNINLKLNYLIN
jgi:hypothetical protein